MPVCSSAAFHPLQGGKVFWEQDMLRERLEKRQLTQRPCSGLARRLPPKLKLTSK